VEETIAALEALVPNPTARLMLCDIYRKGAQVRKWMPENGHGKTNASLNGNGDDTNAASD
jgi:hypothetical protein